MKLFLESLLFPPGLFVVLAVAGLLMLRRRRRCGLWLLTGVAALLYVFSLPMTAAALMALMQTAPVLTPAALARGDAEAIVVLAAGRNRNAREYGGDTLSPLALERLRYGVHLHRLTGLPLVLVGGSTLDETVSEAELLRHAAVEDFGVPVQFIETTSRTTWENAANVAPLLRAHGITHVYLVTHAWHMPRAAWSFARAGIAATPAPTAFVSADPAKAESWLPSARALYNVRLACHELSGYAVYRLFPGS